ncbi:tight adherence protein E [Mesocricetibacter intestinalis]|uniref:Tight adherence protein E n=1 Tax=Mesocricetibacter intestinalis TaxID=1521930 RepID=A0A4V3D9L3_9PAST|nr:TadE family protein [Mesocricetibacter intestinalis]TDQ57631.1 tight adherence protein E [Mesocricetibacter intestinalis]
MIKSLKQMLRQPQGVSTVEFTLTIGIFFTVVFIIFELSRFAVISAYWDLAVTESVRMVKNQRAPNNDYAALFEKTLLEQRRNLENGTIALLGEKRNSLKVDVKYADTVADLANENFRQPRIVKGQQVPPSGRNASLALYTLEYGYSPLIPLPFLPRSWTNHLLERKIVMVQEYERSQFQYQN